MAEYTHYQDAVKYSRDVVSGKIPACKWVRLACQRQIDDRKRWPSLKPTSKDPYWFDRESANRVCKFIELLPHTKGKWQGQLIALEPWQKFILSTVFGWMRSKDNSRRFRELYLEVPRKNGKSLLAATIGLYMLTEDGEGGAEIYSGATTEKQSWETFKPARLMALQADGFTEHYGLNVNASNISNIDSGSKFEPIIGTPGDGASPSCAICDEMHEHKTSELYDTMLTGMGARIAPLMIIVTTAGSDIAGPCYDKRSDVCKMLDGIDGFENNDLFGIIYTIDLAEKEGDDGDDWTDIESWKIANPNYGISVFEDFLEARLKEAIRKSTRQNINKTKHLNIWVNAAESWMNIEKWSKCGDKTLKIEDFKGETCWIGMDLASKIDLCAIVILFKRDGHYYFFGKYYLPEAQLEGADKSHYAGWDHDGLLEITPGNMTDYRYIEDDLIQILSDYEVADMGFDPHNATYLITRLMEKGFEDRLTEIGQNVNNISEPMKAIEALTLDGKLHHDGDPILTWMMSNVVVKPDRNDNIYPRKEKFEKKIDGVFSAIMALNREMAHVDNQYSEVLFI
jgi:phage terminase large subunit-like protein